MFTKLASVIVITTLCVSSINARPGSWKTIPLTKSLKEFVGTSVANRNIYDFVPQHRICLKDVKSLKRQVVNGFNYDFVVEACQLRESGKSGYCKDYSCKVKQYDVKIYKNKTHTIVKAINLPDYRALDKSVDWP